MVPDEHDKYAHGNVLMWHNAFNSEMYQQGVTGTGKDSAYWKARFNKVQLPDNMGTTWIASSTCDQIFHSVEGAWLVYAKGQNKTCVESLPAHQIHANTAGPSFHSVTPIASLTSHR